MGYGRFETGVPSKKSIKNRIKKYRLSLVNGQWKVSKKLDQKI